MAMTTEQITAMINTMHEANLVASRNAETYRAQQAQQQLQMDAMQRLLTDNINQKTEEKAKAAEAKITKKGDKELDARQFNRVDKFDGGEISWAEWKNDLEVIITGLNSDFANLMKMCNSNDSPIGPDYYAIIADDWKLTAQKRSHELLSVLFILVTGEAKALIKSQTDGLEAWRILCQAYSRRTLARTVRLYKEAILPSPAKSLTEVITKISEWENKVNDLKSMEGKDLDPMIRLATLTEICTSDIKDMIFQQIGTVKKLDDMTAGQTYKDIREKVISWVSNRVAASSSVTMNIGNVQAEEECYPCDDGYDYLDVNAMMGKCYNCGQVGHPARLCPSKGQGKGKGTGKGGGGFGKGGQKGGGKGGYHQAYNPKGVGKGGAQFTKGGGKGYQGTCWTCGMVGHKSAECRGGTMRANLVEAEGEETEVTTRAIGGVWLMNVNKVKTSNQYQALTQADEEEEKEEEQEEGGHWIEAKRKAVKKIKANRVTGRNWKEVEFTRNFTEHSPSSHPKALPPSNRTQGSPEEKRDVNVVEKLIAAAARTETAVCQMTFHLTDASKILASVNKMTETGNEVTFNKVRSYIKSPTGKKAFLKKRNGVYILDVIFFNGDEAVQGEVVIDSGAADHVMPRGMLGGVVTREKEAGIKFVAADGAEIGNYGRKDVQFVPADFWEEEFGSPFTGRA